MPALVAYRINAFPQLVKNLEAAKKPKMVVIVAIMRKLAKIAYYIYKRPLQNSPKSPKFPPRHLGDFS